MPVALAARCDGAILVRHGDTESAALVAERADVMDAALAALVYR